MATWQPIATAPRDGTPVLVYWPYWSPTEPCIAHYCGNTGGWDGERCVYPTHEGAFPERQPSQWQPLPELPNGESL